MAIGHTDGDVAGTESSRHGAIDIGSLQIAVTKVLHAHSNCTVLAHALAITKTGKVGIADIAHVVDAHLMVKLRPQQGGVLLNKVDVVVDDGEVVAAQAIDMA